MGNLAEGGHTIRLLELSEYMEMDLQTTGTEQPHCWFGGEETETKTETTILEFENYTSLELLSPKFSFSFHNMHVKLDFKCEKKHFQIARGCPEYISSVVEVSNCSN